MHAYLLVNDYRKDFDKFQWLEFLRIEDKQTLIREHFFTATEASSYLRLIRLFMKFSIINAIIFCNGCCGVMGRMLYMAYNSIPFHWFVLSTVPNAVVFMFATQTASILYNYVILTFFANVMFIRKSFQSLVVQRSALCQYKLKKNKLRQVVKRNLLQFNYIVWNFNLSQANFNYTFSYRSV